MTYTFFVAGTHCNACKHLIEEALLDESDVLNVQVSLSDETVKIVTTGSDDRLVLMERLNEILKKNGYELHEQKPVAVNTKQDWFYAVPIVAVLLSVFIFAGGTGFALFIGSQEGAFTTALFVGLVASVSSCLAVVGALVLSISATYAHENRGWATQALFHAGRVVGFFILGGLLGVLGDVVQLSIFGSTVLGVIASVIMLILGVHLLDITKIVRALSLPKGISQTITALAHKSGTFAPILLGAATFFLPCGFTQSMQVVALSSGSFVTGSLTMLAFALGTLPVLALLSFGSLDLAKSKFKGIFFKVAGLLVIVFALYNIHNALAAFGVIKPLINIL